MGNTKFSVGWGEVDITPDNRVVELSGQYYSRIANGIHSRLKAVALILEKDGEYSIMITLDILGVPLDFYKQLKDAISIALPHISPERIVINAIHTHNAPEVFIWLNDWWKSDPEAITIAEYRTLIETRVVELVKMAWKSIRPAGIAYGLGFARVGHCRRAVYANGTAEMYGQTNRPDFIGMESGEDSGVEMMFFFDEKSFPSGMIVNIACPSQMMELTYKISSDFMGALREKLKKEFGPDFKTICQVSAAGCQSPRDLARNYKGEPDFWHEDGVEIMSGRLLDAVKKTYYNVCGNIDFSPELKHLSKKLNLPKRRVSYWEYISARNEMESLESSQNSISAYKDFCDSVHKNEKTPCRPGPNDDKNMHFVQIRNREAVVNRYNEQDSVPNISTELHVIRIGEAVFATNPFELFLDFGQILKARSKAKQTFIIQLANGHEGYLPSFRAESLGGYGALIINGTVGSNAGTQLIDETIKEINKLF